MVEIIWNIFSRMPAGSKEKMDYAADCYKGNFIAVGWNKLKDLDGIDWKELKRRVKKEYGGSTQGIAARAASLWAFYHDVSPGHYVVCPDKFSDRCYLGQIVGKPFHGANAEQSDCPFTHRRKVKWFKSVPYAQLQRKWGTRFAGNQTVSRINASKNDFNSLVRGRTRVISSGRSTPYKPDQEWGQKAEERALAWLSSTRDQKPKDVSKENKGWDIECGEGLYEVKGRKSHRTKIRLTQNEWAAARRHKKRYTLLLFTAADERALRKQSPKEFPNPAETESWTEAPRTIYEYFLEE